jgi:hypothetical protein
MKRSTLLPVLLAVALSTMAAVSAQSAAAAVPTVTGFAPASGPPAWSVTLTGTGFTGATTVTFTPTDLAYSPKQATFTVPSDTTIVATVPFFAALPLETTLTVKTPDGTATSVGDFAIDGRVGLSEHRGSRGESITLTGSGFTGATRVAFGTWHWPVQGDEPFVLVDPLKARFQVLSDTTIAATVPALRVGGHFWVKVVSPTATSVSAYATPFRVVRPRLLKINYGAFAVRPATITPSGDGTFNIGDLGGPIHWRVWSARRAYGLGTVWIDNGIPNEALGTFFGHPGSVTALRVRGGLFTRMTVRWLDSGHRRSATLKLAKAHAGSWFWR